MSKFINKIGIIFLVLILLFTSITTINPTLAINSNSEIETSDVNVAKWTVMYYMCGDSNMDIFIDPLLEKLSGLGSDDELNIVCFVDKIGYGNTRLIYINETGEQIKLNDLYDWPDEVDTSNLNTFELFCTTMMKEYPAEYYALIIYASAGTGWQRYYFGDKDGNNFNTIPDFANSLKNIVDESGHIIDVFVGSCAINLIENVYEFYPSVGYVVGTQDCLPHDHVVPMFFYAVSELKNNKNLTPEGFANSGPMQYTPVSFIYNVGYGEKLRLINKIFDKLPFKQFHSIVHHSNLGAINASKIVNLTECFNDLSSTLLLHIKDKDIIKNIKESRSQVLELAKCGTKYRFLYKFFLRYPFEFLAFDVYVDMYDLVRIFKENIQNDFIKAKCDNVLQTIDETITYVAVNPNASNCGINIYFPENKYTYNLKKDGGKLPSLYEDLKFSEDTSWDEFLREYLNI